MAPISQNIGSTHPDETVVNDGGNDGGRFKALMVRLLDKTAGQVLLPDGVRSLKAFMHENSNRLQWVSARELAASPAVSNTMRSLFVTSDADPITRFL